jgi:hypothetical protein
MATLGSAGEREFANVLQTRIIFHGILQTDLQTDLQTRKTSKRPSLLELLDFPDFRAKGPLFNP